MAIKYGTRIVVQTQGVRGTTALTKNEVWGEGHARVAQAWLTEFTAKSADPVVHHYFEPITLDDQASVQ